MEKKETKASFSYRENDVNHELTVYSISNGFILETYKSWYEGTGDKKEYKSSTEKTYYKDNPLGKIIDSKNKTNKKDKSKDTLEGLKGAMDKMNAVRGLFNM